MRVLPTFLLSGIGADSGFFLPFQMREATTDE